MKDAFLNGEVEVGFTGDSGRINVALGARLMQLGAQNDGDETDWFYTCSEPSKIRALGRVIIAAGDALEDLQAKEQDR